MTPVPLASVRKRADIFEVVNARLRESMIAVTAAGLTALRLRLRSSPPAAIAHWDPADALEFVALAESLGALDAERFVGLFLRTPQRNGWILRAWRE